MAREESYPLYRLLSALLIAFTHDFDRELQAIARAAGLRKAPPSLAMWADVLRFIDGDGVEARRLPDLSGVAAPAIRSMVATLRRHGWVASERSGGRGHRLRLTRDGKRLAAAWQSATTKVEGAWRRRYGATAMTQLRAWSQKIAVTLEPGLPHYPVALPHRGGDPTGH